MKVFLALGIVLIFGMAIGCSEKNRSDQQDSSSSRIDVRDPQIVAGAFYRGLVRKDYDAMKAHIHPDQDPDAFISGILEELKEAPPLPVEPEFQVLIRENNADAKILNWFDGAKLELEFSDGRWWIVI